MPERAPHVGRAREFAAAKAAWLHVRDGGGGAVLVSGAAGIGKSRLLRELARDAHRAGSTVLYGRCDEDLAIPYRPFVECLSQVVTAAGDTTLAALGPARLAELGRMVPSVAERRVDPPAPAGALGDVERYQLFGAVAALLTSLAARSPVVVLLDDLQWADRPTLQLLRHLVGLNVGSILFVGAHRDVARPSAPLVEHLGRLPVEAVLARIALGGLARRGRVDPAFGNGGSATRRFRRRPGRQVVSGERRQSVLPGGDVPPPAGERGHHRAAASTVYRRYGPRCRRAARQHPRSAVGQARRPRTRRRARALRRFRDRRAVQARPARRNRTRRGHRARPARRGHPGRSRRRGRRTAGRVPVRRTRWCSTPSTASSDRRGAPAPTPGWRSRWRQRGGFQPGELAYQFLAGATAETAARAIHYAREAGRRALTASAPDEAVRWYTAALQALPQAEEAERVRTLIDLGIAQRHAGKPEFRASLLTAARVAERIGRDDLLIDAAVATNRGSFSSLGSVDTDKIDVLRAALLVAAPDTRQRARLLSVLAGELAWHPDHELRVATADDAVTAARRTGDPATLLFAILQPGPADWIPETCAQRVRLLREAAALADRIADRHSYFGAQLLLATYLLESGSAERVDDMLDALVAAAADVHEPFTRWISRYARGCQALAHGELARAELAWTPRGASAAAVACRRQTPPTSNSCSCYAGSRAG